MKKILIAGILCAGAAASSSFVVGQEFQEDAAVKADALIKSIKESRARVLTGSNVPTTKETIEQLVDLMREGSVKEQRDGAANHLVAMAPAVEFVRVYRYDNASKRGNYWDEYQCQFQNSFSTLAAYLKTSDKDLKLNTLKVIESLRYEGKDLKPAVQLLVATENDQEVLDAANRTLKSIR